MLLSFYLSLSPSPPPSPSHPLAYPSPTFSLATACDSPLTNGSLCTILTTVHYPRLWFFGPWLPRRAGEMHSREMHRRGGDVLRKTLGGMESRWNRNPRVYARTERLLSWNYEARKQGGDFRGGTKSRHNTILILRFIVRRSRVKVLNLLWKRIKRAA